jgi:diguanylate cyclase (GGDEF)-like protein
MVGLKASKSLPALASETYEAAEAERLAGRYEAARSLGERAIAEVKASGEPQVLILIRAQILLSKVCKVLGDLKAALSAIRQAEVAARDLGDQHLLCSTLYMGVAIKAELGLHEDCMAAVEEALEIATRMDDAELLYWCYNRAGLVQTDLGRHQVADELMRKSLHHGEGLGDEEKFCILNNLADNIANWEASLAEGDAHLPRHVLERAVEYGESALNYARRAENPYREALILATLGNVLGVLGRFDAAFGAIDLSETLAERHDYPTMKLTALHMRGKVRLFRQDARGAVACLEVALGMSNDIGDDISSRDICRCLATAWEQLGDAAVALKHYRNHHQFDRKISSAQAELKASMMIDRVALMNAQSETKKAKAEGLALAAQSAELEVSVRSLTEIAEQADRMAQTDALTGLFNRHFLNTAFLERIKRARENGRPLSVALVDADHFKTVNDRFGHAVGDRVLQVLAGILRGGMRADDFAVRYGGEEVLLLLSDVASDTAAVICERLRREIETYDWATIAEGLQVTASFGLAELSPGDTMESFVARADVGLYAAKSGGRNCLKVA